MMMIPLLISFFSPFLLTTLLSRNLYSFCKRWMSPQLFGSHCVALLVGKEIKFFRVQLSFLHLHEKLDGRFESGNRSTTTALLLDSKKDRCGWGVRSWQWHHLFSLGKEVNCLFIFVFLNLPIPWSGVFNILKWYHYVLFVPHSKTITGLCHQKEEALRQF